MNEALVIGYIVLAIITLGSFIGVVMKFIQPIHKLEIVIQKLNDKLDNIMNNDTERDKRIAKHGEEIDKLDHRVGKIETKMDFYHRDN